MSEHASQIPVYENLEDDIMTYMLLYWTAVTRLQLQGTMS